MESPQSRSTPWTVTPGVIDSAAIEPAHSGAWKAWMDGYGTTHTDSLLQTSTTASGMRRRAST